MSEKKQTSNRNNSRKSTGPKTDSGKQTVSQNARRHGILSTHLVLENESLEEFDLLLLTLQQEMVPFGLLEQALVERIAVAMWRQRRLIRAETAEVELKQRTLHGKELLAAVNFLGISASDQRLKNAINFPHMPFIEGGSEGIGISFANMLALSLSKESLSLDQIEELFPLAYDELLDSAGGTKLLFLEKLTASGKELRGYVIDLIAAFRQLYDHERIKELVRLYRDSAQVRASVDLIGRYQSALDNELYKAIRALREAQNWRLIRIQAEAHRIDGAVALT